MLFWICPPAPQVRARGSRSVLRHVRLWSVRVGTPWARADLLIQITFACVETPSPYIPLVRCNQQIRERCASGAVADRREQSRVDLGESRVEWSNTHRCPRSAPREESMRNPKAFRIALVAAVWGVGCVAAEGAESVGEHTSALGASKDTDAGGVDADEPGTSQSGHAAIEPWVACRGARHQLGTDVLGPVVAHGYVEAPGFRAGLLDADQLAAFGSSILRLGPKDAELRVSNVGRLTERSSNEQLKRYVDAALTLANRRNTYATSVDRFWAGDTTTATSWDIVFQWRGIELLGFRCWVDSPAGEGATVSCVSPPTSPPTSTEPFSITTIQAEAIARATMQAPAALTFAHQRYLLATTENGQIAQARFLVDVQNGRDAYNVTLDGTGAVLDVRTVGRTFIFRGYDVSYNANDGPVVLESPIDAVPDIPALDTNPKALTAPVRCSGICSDPYRCGVPSVTSGIGVCGNAELTYTNDDGTTAFARPRGDGDFSNPGGPTDKFGPQLILERPLLATTYAGHNETPSEKMFFSPDPATDEQKSTAPVHFAELQAFYSATKLQRWYELLGFRSCRSNSDCKAPLSSCEGGTPTHWGLCGGNQSDRLQLYVLQGSAKNSTSTTPHSLSLGWLNSPVASPNGDYQGGTGHDFDMASEGSVFAHEYQHYIQYSVRPPPFHPTECNEDCEYGALAEGMSDFYSAAYLHDSAVGRFLSPVGFSRDYCAAPFNYFPTIKSGTIANLRFACNTQYYKYWKTSPDTPGDPSKDYEIHLRGQITFNALYTFHRRLVDAGLSETLVPGYVLRAQARVLQEHDDERILLDRLLAELLAQPNVQRRFTKTAQAKFEEKGVFPSAGASRDSIVCNVADSCLTTDARDIMARTLVVEGPLEAQASGDPAVSSPPPLFDGFAPTGDVLQQTAAGLTKVTVEFSTSRSFSTINASETWVIPSTSVGNNSPVGFFRLTPSAATWEAAVAAARTSPTRFVYYRLSQCLASNPAACIYTSKDGGVDTPYIHLTLVGQPGPGGSACTVSVGMANRKATAWLALLGVGMAALLRRRRVS